MTYRIEELRPDDGGFTYVLASGKRTIQGWRKEPTRKAMEKWLAKVLDDFNLRITDTRPGMRKVRFKKEETV